MSLGELSYSSLKTANQVREADEIRHDHRKKQLLFLILQHLVDDGYLDAASTLSREANVDIARHRVCDNIDLSTILQEYESFYFVKFGKYPKLTRKTSADDDRVITLLSSGVTRTASSGTSGNTGSTALSNSGSNNGDVQQRYQKVGGSAVVAAVQPLPKLSPANSNNASSSVTGKYAANKRGARVVTASNRGASDDASDNGSVGAPSTEPLSATGPADLMVQGSNRAPELYTSARTGHHRPSVGAEQIPSSQMAPQERLLRPLGALNYNGELRELAEIISRDIYLSNPNVRWEDIVGLDGAKRLIKESVVYPIKYPALFSGILAPWKGLLLYGPPGTGKTLLAKAVATECGTTFFNISASTIVSKWRGDSEKLVRVLFDLARFHAPSTIFLDEIDALMSQRGAGGGSTDHEASRRMKTELLIQMDGLTKSEDLVFLLAASNLPWELDHALLRRLEKRILVGLPSAQGRSRLFEHFLPPVTIQPSGLKIIATCDYGVLAAKTEGYSGADIRLVCKEAAMNSVRKVFDVLELPMTAEQLQMHGRIGGIIDISPISTEDMLAAIQRTKPSAHRNLAQRYADFEREFESV